MLPTRKASEFNRQLFAQVPFVPVLTIDDVVHAKPLAELLVANGLFVIEVTLRTPVALAVIEEMTKVKGAVVGAGTLLNTQDVQSAKDAGCQFGVSPGWTSSLATACWRRDLPLLPGVSTMSDVVWLYERGFDMMKFFPAEASGGVKVLKAFGGPMPQVSFCPTGGITQDNFNDYLSLDNVITVGGTWLVKTQDLQASNYDAIDATIKSALAHIKS